MIELNKTPIITSRNVEAVTIFQNFVKLVQVVQVASRVFFKVNGFKYDLQCMRHRRETATKNVDIVGNGGNRHRTRNTYQ